MTDETIAAITAAITNAMPSTEQILDAIYLAVTDAIERNPDTFNADPPGETP
jgi:hypothetical protein